MRKITFYEQDTSNSIPFLVHGYKETVTNIMYKLSFSTTQMCLLSTRLFTEFDYDEIEIVNLNWNSIYITYDKETKQIKCTNTNRELKIGHNLFKLWENGEFSC